MLCEAQPAMYINLPLPWPLDSGVAAVCVRIHNVCQYAEVAKSAAHNTGVLCFYTALCCVVHVPWCICLGLVAIAIPCLIAAHREGAAALPAAANGAFKSSESTQESHTLTGAIQPCLGTGLLCREQSLHTPWPQLRQW